jgi:hypothetical protein
MLPGHPISHRAVLTSLSLPRPSPPRFPACLRLFATAGALTNMLDRKGN